MMHGSKYVTFGKEQEILHTEVLLNSVGVYSLSSSHMHFFAEEHVN